MSRPLDHQWQNTALDVAGILTKRIWAHMIYLIIDPEDDLCTGG